MTTHELKTWPEFFELIVSGQKTFEIRKNDRDYQSGDLLVLREYDPSTDRYSGDEKRFRVGFVFKQGFGIDLGGQVVMSLVPVWDEHTTTPSVTDYLAVVDGETEGTA